MYSRVHISSDSLFSKILKKPSMSQKKNDTLEIQRSQYIRPKVTVHKCAQTIQGKKKIKGRNYTRKYSKLFTKKCGKLKLSPQGRDLALFVLLTKVEIPSEIKPSFANP